MVMLIVIPRNPYNRKEIGVNSFIKSKITKLATKPEIAPAEFILGKKMAMAKTPPSPPTSNPNITLK